MTKTRTLFGFGICALMVLTGVWFGEEAANGHELAIGDNFRLVMASSEAMEYIQADNSSDELEASPLEQESRSSTIQGSLALLGLAGIALMRGSK